MTLQITVSINAYDPADLAGLAAMFAALQPSTPAVCTAAPAAVAPATPAPAPVAVAEPMQRIASVPVPPMDPVSRALVDKALAKLPTKGAKRGRPSKADLAAREAAARGEAPAEPVVEAPQPPAEPKKTVCPAHLTQEQFEDECRLLKNQLMGVMALRGEPFIVGLLKQYAGTHKFSCLPYEAHGPILASAVAEAPGEKHPEAITEEELLAAMPVAKAQP